MTAIVDKTLRKMVGDNLRAARKRRGWSLNQACEASADRFPAVVLGSYERGDRAVTVDRLVAIAYLYGVPAASLLPDFSTDAKLRASVLEDVAEELRRQAAELRGDEVSVAWEEAEVL